MTGMPIVAEGDERVSLQRILEERTDRVSEREIWAICKEACVALDQLSPASAIFQRLCITPDSLAFDNAGNICFLLLPVRESRFHVSGALFCALPQKKTFQS